MEHQKEKNMDRTWNLGTKAICYLEPSWRRHAGVDRYTLNWGAVKELYLDYHHMGIQ